MRRIALINQKGGVGKTTTAANLGAALALAGKRVVLVDLDPQANLTLHLGVELPAGAPSTYRVLTGEVPFAAALRDTDTPNLRLLPTDIHLSGAELELSSAEGREHLLRTAVAGWTAAPTARASRPNTCSSIVRRASGCSRSTRSPPPTRSSSSYRRSSWHCRA
jgi:chromosome partitioning protein